MADGRDDRQRGGGNGAGERLVVESGEVFQRTSAARDQDEIDLSGELAGLNNFAQALLGLDLVEPADSRGDRGGAFGALHRRRIDQQIQARVATANNFDDVVKHRSAGGGDDADRTREGGQRALASGVEEAFGQQARLELFVRKLQSPCAARFQRLGDELKLAARLVDGDAAAHQNGQSVLRLEAQQLRLAAEEHHRKLRLAVF